MVNFPFAGKGKSYDSMASYYDLFSLVLGKPYRDSKFSFLQKLDIGDKVLYIGGGTGGNIIEILGRIGKSGRLYFMEASAKMIEKAKKRIPLSLESRVVFLHQSDFADLPLKTFDVVLTQYLLDILPDKEIGQLLQETNKRTDENSQWIFVDFFEVKGKRWLIKLMVCLFRFFTGNPRRDLPNYEDYFVQYGWQIHKRKSLDRGFIQGWLLRREI